MAARELETDQSEEAFDRVVRDIAKSPKPKKVKEPADRRRAPKRRLSRVREIRRHPHFAIGGQLHDVDGASAIVAVFVAFAAYRDCLAVRRFIRPTPLIPVVLVHPVRRVLACRHWFAPLLASERRA